MKTGIEPWEYGREKYQRRSEVERLFRRLKRNAPLLVLREAQRDVLGLSKLRAGG